MIGSPSDYLGVFPEFCCCCCRTLRLAQYKPGVWLGPVALTVRKWTPCLLARLRALICESSIYLARRTGKPASNIRMGALIAQSLLARQPASQQLNRTATFGQNTETSGGGPHTSFSSVVVFLAPNGALLSLSLSSRSTDILARTFCSFGLVVVFVYASAAAAAVAALRNANSCSVMEACPVVS